MIILIIGPMFSSKTTTCISIVRKYSFSGKKCLFIGHSSDTRYHTEDDFESKQKYVYTHDKNKIEAIHSSDLKDNLTEIDKHDVIGVDEIQFFTENSIDVIKEYSDKGKIFVCSGLNGDFNRNPFNNVSNLIGHAREIVFLKAVCMGCVNRTGVYDMKNIDTAIYSHKLVKTVKCDKTDSSNSRDDNDVVDVGGIDKYIPVCEKCYVELNCKEKERKNRM